jgi:hypothetical protein
MCIRLLTSIVARPPAAAPAVVPAATKAWEDRGAISVVPTEAEAISRALSYLPAEIWGIPYRRVARVPGCKLITTMGAPGPSHLGTWETTDLIHPFP